MKAFAAIAVVASAMATGSAFAGQVAIPSPAGHAAIRIEDDASRLPAVELPSALDAAGQLQRLPVEAQAGFGWLRVVGAVLAGAGTASAADLPSALDAAGQLQRLPVEAHAGFGWVRTAGGVVFQVHGITKSVLFYGDGVVRVSAHKGETYTRQPSLVVVASPQAPQLDIAESADALTVAGPGLRVVVDKRTGTLAFQRPDGTPLVREQEAPVLTPGTEPSGPRRTPSSSASRWRPTSRSTAWASTTSRTWTTAAATC